MNTLINAHKAGKGWGFTLIELMVVIAIIGILATIVTVSLTSARAKGRDAKRVSDLRTLQLAIESYYNDNGFFPSTNLYSGGSIYPTYMSVLPKDPKDNTTTYLYSAYNTSSNPTGTANCLGKATSYHLAAVMESTDGTNPTLKQDVDSGASNTWTACSGTTASFDGNAVSCSGTSAGGSDNCYDQTN